MNAPRLLGEPLQLTFDAGEILGRPRVANVEVNCRAHVAVGEHRQPANDDELHLRFGEPSKQRGKVRHGFERRLRSSPARSSSAVRISASIDSIRSVGVIVRARDSWDSSTLGDIASRTRYCQGSSTGRHM